MATRFIYEGKQRVRADTAKTSAGTAASAITSATLVAANPDRVSLTVTNVDSTDTVSLALGATAVSLRGIPLFPHGSVEIKDYTGIVTFISSANTPSVAYVEV